jgi:hypothetical protein
MPFPLWGNQRCWPCFPHFSSGLVLDIEYSTFHLESLTLWFWHYEIARNILLFPKIKIQRNIQEQRKKIATNGRSFSQNEEKSRKDSQSTADKSTIRYSLSAVRIYLSRKFSRTLNMGWHRKEYFMRNRHPLKEAWCTGDSGSLHVLCLKRRQNSMRLLPTSCWKLILLKWLFKGFFGIASSRR